MINNRCGNAPVETRTSWRWLSRTKVLRMFQDWMASFVVHHFFLLMFFSKLFILMLHCCLLHVSAHLNLRRINTCGHLFQSYWEAPNLSNSRHQLDCWIFSKGEEWFLLVCKFSCKPPSLMVDHGNHSLNWMDLISFIKKHCNYYTSPHLSVTGLSGY